MKIVEIKKGADNRIIVIFPYNSIYVERIKSIKGRRWHPEEKYCLPAASLWQAGSFPSNKLLGKIKSPLDLILKRGLNDEKN